ncbi:MAG: very short patch repair endonuclease [Stenotrophobium sp.]
MDKLTPQRRSANMAAIRSRDTKPEMIVRKLVYSMGYRYRLHAKELPGKPDIVLRPRRKVIFVHGCFWHQHSRATCTDSRQPRSRKSYWNKKLRGNVERDQQHVNALKNEGWKVLTIWECELQSNKALQRKLIRFLAHPFSNP